MPYIHRNKQNEIIGLTRWPNGSTEILPDNNEEVLVFNNIKLSEDFNIQYSNNSRIFSQPGYEVFNVPYNVSNIIKVKLWGAGGGSSASNSLSQSNHGYSGDYITCDIDIASIENRNLIIHVGGKGRKSIANSYGFSDGAGGGGYSSISTFDGVLLVSAGGGAGGNGVSYDANDTVSAKSGNADNGGINNGEHGGVGEMDSGGKGGIGGGSTYVDETLTSEVNIENGLDYTAVNTSDPYYIPGTNISSGGIIQNNKQTSGIDGGDGLVVIIW